MRVHISLPRRLHISMQIFLDIAGELKQKSNLAREIFPTPLFFVRVLARQQSNYVSMIWSFAYGGRSTQLIDSLEILFRINDLWLGPSISPIPLLKVRHRWVRDLWYSVVKPVRQGQIE